MNSTAIAGRGEIAHVSKPLQAPEEPVSLAAETR